MKTYFIVEHVGCDRSKHWYAHRRGIWSIFGCYNHLNSVSGALSVESADECEELLRYEVPEPKVIRVVKL